MKKLLALFPLIAVAVGCNSADSSSSSVSLKGELKDAYKTADAPPTKAPTLGPPKDGEDVAVVSTKFGNIVFKFRPDMAPKHVENFKTLANKGFYDKTIFHRIIPDFMIQGGDPNTKDLAKTATYGQGDPGYKVKAEFNAIDHKRGVVSMARGNDVDSAGSQFFVVTKDHPDLNNKYTAFGEVVTGIDVAAKIVAQPRNNNDLPNERIEMTVKIAKWPVK